MSLRGRGQAYDDPSALLRGEPGRPVELSMDLTWTTAGTPYQYRMTPRYEIPCTVSGTVVADGRTFALHGVPGQRDHSWGVRDWWSMDWVWSALHLQRRHASARRRPPHPRSAADRRRLHPAAGRSAGRTAGGDGAGNVRRQRLTAGNRADARAPAMSPPRVEIKGHAPVLLTATDGRVSHFPRAWATVTTDDGRTGVGWLEWNRNQR